MVLKGLHGRVEFEVQRRGGPWLIDGATGERRTWLELSGQFPQGHHMTLGLCEVAAYYSNRLSYAEVEGLVERLSGKALLSDQRLEQLVVETAAAVSRAWAQECEAPAPVIDPAVDVYAAESPEVRVFEDGIVVKAQKRGRCSRNRPAAVDPEAAKRVNTEVVLLERRDGSHDYLVIPLYQRVRQAVQCEYGASAEPLAVVALSDGATTIRTSLQAIFGTLPTVILDGYHLDKKTRELMSMIAVNKTDKERHLAVMLGGLWHGEVGRVLAYLRTDVDVRNRAADRADKHRELIGYLEKHRHEIIDYGARQAAGKPVGSGRMEKGTVRRAVDQVIGHRQKKKGMAWSAKGSKALAVLKVVELNGRWQQLWYPEEFDAKAAA